MSSTLMTFGWRNIGSDWAGVCSMENKESLIQFKKKNETLFAAVCSPSFFMGSTLLVPHAEVEIP